MDIVSEPTHHMVQKPIKPNYKPRPIRNQILPTLKVMPVAMMRLSPLTRVSLLKWLALEFLSSVSSFTGAVKSIFML